MVKDQGHLPLDCENWKIQNGHAAFHRMSARYATFSCSFLVICWNDRAASCIDWVTNCSVQLQYAANLALKFMTVHQIHNSFPSRPVWLSWRLNLSVILCTPSLCFFLFFLQRMNWPLPTPLHDIHYLLNRSSQGSGDVHRAGPIHQTDVQPGRQRAGSSHRRAGPCVLCCKSFVVDIVCPLPFSGFHPLKFVCTLRSAALQTCGLDRRTGVYCGSCVARVCRSGAVLSHCLCVFWRLHKQQRVRPSRRPAARLAGRHQMRIGWRSAPCRSVCIRRFFKVNSQILRHHRSRLLAGSGGERIEISGRPARWRDCACRHNRRPVFITVAIFWGDYRGSPTSRSFVFFEM